MVGQSDRHREILLALQRLETARHANSVGSQNSDAGDQKWIVRLIVERDVRPHLAEARVHVELAPDAVDPAVHP